MGRCLGADLRERWVDLLEGRYSRLNFFKKKRGGGDVGVETGRVCLFVYLGLGLYISAWDQGPA